MTTGAEAEDLKTNAKASSDARPAVEVRKTL
jgi:hypothetical protein